MTDRELMQMALDALSNFNTGNHGMRWQVPVIKALRARLAQPDVPESCFGETKPVAWISHNAGLYHGKPDESLNPLPLYTAPPQREWVGLTRAECGLVSDERFVGALWAEAKLKEKNT